jgi:hypothetical protein
MGLDLLIDWPSVAMWLWQQDKPNCVIKGSTFQARERKQTPWDISRMLLLTFLDVSITSETPYNQTIWSSNSRYILSLSINLPKLTSAVDSARLRIIKNGLRLLFKYFYSATFLSSRSQRPRGIRHELSSLARTLGSRVRIPLKALMSVCVYSVCVVLCAGSGLAKGWSPIQGVLPTPTFKEFYRLCTGLKTASVVYWSEFLATDPEDSGSIHGATRFSEK